MWILELGKIKVGKLQARMFQKCWMKNGIALVETLTNMDITSTSCRLSWSIELCGRCNDAMPQLSTHFRSYGLGSLSSQRPQAWCSQKRFWVLTISRRVDLWFYRLVLRNRWFFDGMKTSLLTDIWQTTRRYAMCRPDARFACHSTGEEYP